METVSFPLCFLVTAVSIERVKSKFFHVAAENWMAECALTAVYQIINGGATIDVESGAALQDVWTAEGSESRKNARGEKVSNGVAELAACKDMSVAYCIS